MPTNEGHTPGRFPAEKSKAYASINRNTLPNAWRGWVRIGAPVYLRRIDDPDSLAARGVIQHYEDSLVLVRLDNGNTATIYREHAERVVPTFACLEPTAHAVPSTQGDHFICGNRECPGWRFMLLGFCNVG